MKTISELQQAVQEWTAAVQAARTGVQELEALRTDLTARIPEWTRQCDPTQPKTLQPIATAELQLRFIPGRVELLQAEVARESSELRAAIHVAHAEVASAIAGKETALKAALLASVRPLVGDEASAEALASDAYFKNAVADQLRDVRTSMSATHIDPLVAAQSILIACELLETITIPAKL